MQNIYSLFINNLKMLKDSIAISNHLAIFMTRRNMHLYDYMKLKNTYMFQILMQYTIESSSTSVFIFCKSTLCSKMKYRRNQY